MTEAPADQALMFIVSGPAGSGKTTLCERMIKELSPRMQRVITATTRPPRQGEVNGLDYYFLSEDEFKNAIHQGKFYEHAKVHSYNYGVLKEEINSKLAKNIDLLINIDVQGAETLRMAAKENPELKNRVISIFIMPIAIEVIKDRLQGRGLDTQEEIERRLEVAQQEVRYWTSYDYCIPSQTKEEDFSCLLSLYAAEKLRVRKA